MHDVDDNDDNDNGIHNDGGIDHNDNDDQKHLKLKD